MIKVATSFSGVGCPEMALAEMGIPHRVICAGDIDKYAKLSYDAIHDPKHWHDDFTALDYSSVDKADLAVFGFPCQAFSLAGKRKGFDDVRGTLFFNVAEFMRINKPEIVVLENVKGLLSHDKGRTFQTIVDLLSNCGGSVNGQTSLDVFEDGLGYHIYYQVLNTKDFGIPQNRERIFIVCFKKPRDFNFPKPFPLKKRLKDVLEENVDEKYYLSDKMINYLTDAKRAIGFTDTDKKQSANCVISTYYKMPTDCEYIKVKSATSKGYEIATDEDSINFSQPNSETRRGRVGKSVPQTLDTNCNQGVLVGAIRGRGKNNQQQLEINETGNSNSITTVQKDNVVVTGIAVHPNSKKLEFNGFKDTECPSLLATDYKAPKCIQYSDYRIRRLTPLECWRLQGFSDDDFYKAKEVCSDTQLYRQAGNSMSKNVMIKLFEKILKTPQ